MLSATAGIDIRERVILLMNFMIVSVLWCYLDAVDMLKRAPVHCSCLLVA